MRRMLLIACLIGILTSAMVVSASATETVWTMFFTAGSGGTYTAPQGANGEAWAASRTSASTVDDPSVKDPGENTPPPAQMASTVTAAWYRPSYTGGTPAYPWAWLRDIRQPMGPGKMIKEYADLVVWANAGYTAENIVIFIQGAGVPNTVAGQAVAYKLVMTYAPQGYSGQTEWLLPAAPGGTAKSPWFTITLPAAGAIASNPVEGDGPFAAVQTAGYRFTLVTPEPGSLLALGAGLSGFLGMAYRRRK